MGFKEIISLKKNKNQGIIEKMAGRDFKRSSSPPSLLKAGSASPLNVPEKHLFNTHS